MEDKRINWLRKILSEEEMRRALLNGIERPLEMCTKKEALIDGSFDWASSNEGEDYWDTIHLHKFC